MAKPEAVKGGNPAPDLVGRSIAQVVWACQVGRNRMEKTRLLYVGDYSNTGFGTVAKGLLRGLAKLGTYDIMQVGVNVHPDMPKTKEPWRIVPASPKWDIDDKEQQTYATDPYGYSFIQHYAESFDPDIVFINNDYAVAKKYMETMDGKPTALAKHRSVKVLYSPVDAEPAPAVYGEIAALYDLNIAYSAWQRQLMSELDPMYAFMPVLYHGYNADTMFPMDKMEARQKVYETFAKYNDGVEPEAFKSMLDNSFLIYFLGANQFRKDIPCLFRAVALLQEEVPNAYLIPQANSVPSGPNGWVLPNLQTLTGLKNAVLMKKANLFTEEEINYFYNAADVLAYPTRGEGFGLPSLEAMATKTPVVATRFGPQEELHARGRGYFIDIIDVIPGDIVAWGYFVLPDHRSLYKQLKFVHDNPEHAAETAERAYEWAKPLTWDNQAKELDSILRKIPIVAKEDYADIVQAT